MQKILIIDDELDSLFVLSRLLQKKGFEVDILSTGETAIESAEKIRPDLILLDIKLDDNYDGRDICRQLKANDKTRMAKIFLSSAHVTINSMYKEHGEDDFIPKPIILNELIKKINDHLNGNSNHFIHIANRQH